jgi:hypothetical protein
MQAYCKHFWSFGPSFPATTCFRPLWPDSAGFIAFIVKRKVISLNVINARVILNEYTNICYSKRTVTLRYVEKSDILGFLTIYHAQTVCTLIS